MVAVKSGRGCKSKTEGIEEQILTELENNNYHSRQQIVDMVEEKFQVSISRSAVGRLLKNGIKWLKIGSFPAKADTGMQKDFYDSTLHPLM